MKQPFFTNTFYKFFFGFLAIVGLAFVVMMVAGSQAPSATDIIAQPGS